MVSSYLRMTWKVSNYNSLREQVSMLRGRYQELQRENTEKKEQLASLQLMASEVSVALGLKRRIEGADDIAGEGPRVPSVKEPIEGKNFLKSRQSQRVGDQSSPRWE